ncbi:MAG: hypothetical protein HY929_09320 [Euryarchaeota archaeon]|nr:hypothetical protein [Euryarchaeota archaeon]
MISPEYKWVVSSIICFTLTGALILLHHIVEFSEKEMFEALTTLLAVVFYIVGVAMLFKSSLVIKGIFETLRKELEKSS